MARDELRALQLRQQPHRAVVLLGAALALGLALLTSVQTRVWASDAALWSHAVSVAPQSPRPVVNLATVFIKEGDDVQAEALLVHAIQLARLHSPVMQAWTQDVVSANAAVLRIRQGRLLEARAFLFGAPTGSTRWRVCQQVRGLC